MTLRYGAEPSRHLRSPEIWNNGDGKSIEEMLGLAIPFEFTNIIYNAEEDGFRLEWNFKAEQDLRLVLLRDIRGI